ncbi:hypothetical protein APSETT445_008977 [Aspergillus pseudonomiae]
MCPLATAIQFNQEEMALWLIGQGADVTEWLMGTGLTILNLAAGFCSATVVRKVVEILREKVGKTGDIFSPSDNVMVLHRAISRGDVESVRILLDNGADPSGWDIHGVSALTLATANGNEEIVMMLLDRDANPLPHDAVGRSALGCAAGSPKLSWTTVERIFHAYRNAGGDINCTYVTIPEFVGGAPRPLERLPLHQFAAAGSVPGVELLLQYGAQVSTKGRDGMTALHAALFSYRYRRDSDQIINEICRMLVEAAVGSGEDLNNQMTPYTSFMRMRGATALHLAVVCGLQEVVRLLLDHGADAKIVDEEGKTALDLARGLTDHETFERCDMGSKSATCYVTWTTTRGTSILGTDVDSSMVPVTTVSFTVTATDASVTPSSSASASASAKATATGSADASSTSASASNTENAAMGLPTGHAYLAAGGAAMALAVAIA